MRKSKVVKAKLVFVFHLLPPHHQGCMSSVLDLFLEGPWDDITEHVVAAKTSQAAGTSRSAVLLTAENVKEMVRELSDKTLDRGKGMFRNFSS